MSEKCGKVFAGGTYGCSRPRGHSGYCNGDDGEANFNGWMAKVNALIEARLGMSSSDLPDCCYRDWYDEGVTPKGAASRAIKAAKE